MTRLAVFLSGRFTQGAAEGLDNAADAGGAVGEDDGVDGRQVDALPQHLGIGQHGAVGGGEVGQDVVALAGAVGAVDRLDYQVTGRAGTTVAGMPRAMGPAPAIRESCSGFPGQSCGDEVFPDRELSSFAAVPGVVGLVRAPQGRGDDPGVEDFQAVQQGGDLGVRAPPAAAERLLEDLLGLPGLRVVAGAEMADEEVASGRDLVAPVADDAGRVLVIVDVVKDGASSLFRQPSASGAGPVPTCRT